MKLAGTDSYNKKKLLKDAFHLKHSIKLDCHLQGAGNKLAERFILVF